MIELTLLQLFTLLGRESLQFSSPEHSPAYLKHSREHSHFKLNESSKENENGSTSVSEDEEKEHELKQKGIFTYSSCPRSAPHGKVLSTSTEGLPCPENLRSDGDRRGARLEEDFHGSVSNEEEYNWQNYQPKDMSESDEARMLASLRRQQLEELEDDGKSNQLNAVQLGYCVYGDDSISTSSDDTSIWSTHHTGPPVNQGHHYQNEMLLTLSQKKMNPLLLSNPRDVIFNQEMFPLVYNPFALCVTDNTSSDAEDEDEVLDLLYDPCLNCYFDPKTGKYYELA
uniref:Uncharacterized protein n=1 Tax=Callorhinchus milii TaxID=7868 RepID=A0A4W3H0S1_CALMI